MVSTDSYYEITYEFFRGYLNCQYHYYEGFDVDAKSVQINYPKILDMIQSETLAEFLIPAKNIQQIAIYFRDGHGDSVSEAKQSDKITVREIQTIVSYIIKNVPTNKLFINMKDIELNLSQIQPLKCLHISDAEGILPPEYLHHLVKLLENGQVKYIIFSCNINMPIEEDLFEFDKISAEINLVSPADTTTYRIKLKE